MPLTRRGSVSARFSVRFSRRERLAELRGRLRSGFDTAPIVLSQALLSAHDEQARSFLRTGLREHAREPCRKSSAKRSIFRFNGAPRSFQCRRPAIIRCSTSRRSSSSSNTIRLPSREKPRTCLPSIAASGGSNERRRKTLFKRAFSMTSPRRRSLRPFDIDGDVGELRHRCRSVGSNRRATYPAQEEHPTREESHRGVCPRFPTPCLELCSSRTRGQVVRPRGFLQNERRARTSVSSTVGLKARPGNPRFLEGAPCPKPRQFEMTTDPKAQPSKESEGDQATRTATRIGVGVMALVASAALLGLWQRAPEGANEHEPTGKAFRGSVTRLSGSGGLEACDPAGQACRSSIKKAAIPGGSRVRTDLSDARRARPRGRLGADPRSRHRGDVLGQRAHRQGGARLLDRGDRSARGEKALVSSFRVAWCA